jgi:hypothetical protein
VVERLSRPLLPLVQPGALEGLATEVRGDEGDGLGLLVGRLRAVEEEAQRPHDLAACAQRHCDRSLRVRGQFRAVRESGLERRAVLGALQLAFGGGERDGRQPVEREAQAWTVGLRGDPGRVHDDDVVSLDESE